MANPVIAAADIGGSHITVALIDIEKVKVIEHTWIRKTVDAHADAGSVLSAWSDAFEESFRALNQVPESIGIAMPGPFDYKNGICQIKDQNKYESLYGLNIKQLLSEKLAVDPHHIILTNDAACFLQGELFGGVAKGYDKVLGLTLGTGLGAAIASDGIAADANLWCSPFREGIAEDYLSNRWFIRRYEELSGNNVKNVYSLSTRVHAETEAAQVFREFGESLGQFLAPIVQAGNMELVVLGGNIARALPLFEKGMENALEEAGCRVEIRQSILGENANLLGAASNCWREQEMQGAYIIGQEI